MKEQEEHREASPADLAVSTEVRDQNLSEEGRLLYVYPTDKRTDGHGQDKEKTKTYLSIRITVRHNKIQDVIDKVFYDTEYCIYKHNCNGRGKEHIHVGVPGGNDGCYRKRITRFIGSGNDKYSIKQQYNELSGFMFYCGHEDTEPIHSENSPWKGITVDKYYEKQGRLKYVEPRGDKDFQLTYNNLVVKAVDHARKHKLDGTLKAVVQHMCETTKWKPSFHMVKNGVVDYYYKDFEYRMGKRQKFDMDWFTPRM